MRRFSLPLVGVLVGAIGAGPVVGSCLGRLISDRARQVW